MDHAQTKGSGSGGGGAAADSDAPAPPEQGGSTSTYVGTGEPDPVTGIPNTGTPYYLDTVDGRVTRDPILDTSENEMPVLPPTTENVVPTTTTSNDITGCATDTWTAMVNQAVLQTRRETIINSRYIAKGDTVMAYSCLREGLDAVGENIGPIFSESKGWVNKDIDIVGKTVTVNKELGESSLDGAIMNAATVVYMNFAQRAFIHSPLGGMLGGSGNIDIEDPTNEDAGAQDSLPCGIMNDVWQMAKCMNMDDNPLFPRFEELIQPDSDPRKFPSNMSCKNTGITQAMIDKARQKGVATVDTHFDLLYRDISTGDCAPPINTGVTVERQQGIGHITTTITYLDAVCPTLGCSYQKSATGAGKCE